MWLLSLGYPRQVSPSGRQEHTVTVAAVPSTAEIAAIEVAAAVNRFVIHVDIKGPPPLGIAALCYRILTPDIMIRAVIPTRTGCRKRGNKQYSEAR